MKTVIVVYTNELLTEEEVRYKKKYSFNTSKKLKENDLILTDKYNAKLQVIKVLDKSFKYFNASTGELSDNYNSTSQWEVRTLCFDSNCNEDCIKARLVNVDQEDSDDEEDSEDINIEMIL